MFHILEVTKDMGGGGAKSWVPASPSAMPPRQETHFAIYTCADGMN